MSLEKILKSIFHPNRISAYGAALYAGGLFMLGNESTDIYGAGMIALGSVLDGVDGYVARNYNLKTKEGARVDALIDKIKNFMVGGYIIANEIARNNVFLPFAVGANFLVDFVSQRQRGRLTEQVQEACAAVVYPDKCKKDEEADSSIRANYWGKTKTVIQIGVGLLYIGKEVYQNHLGELSQEFNENSSNILCAALLTSAILGGIGVYKRVFGRRSR